MTCPHAPKRHLSYVDTTLKETWENHPRTSFHVCNIEIPSPTFKFVGFFLFVFFLTQQHKHCLEARSPGGNSNGQRSHFLFFLFLLFFFFLTSSFVYCIFVAVLNSLVLLGLKLLLPGLVQVNQSLVVENKKDEVQRVCGDADDAQVL